MPKGGLTNGRRRRGMLRRRHAPGRIYYRLSARQSPQPADGAPALPRISIMQAACEDAVDTVAKVAAVAASVRIILMGIVLG